MIIGCEVCYKCLVKRKNCGSGNAGLNYGDSSGQIEPALRSLLFNC